MSKVEQMEDEAQALIKHGLLLSEHTEELVRLNEDGLAEDILVQQAEQAANNADDAMREKKIAGLLANMGSRLGSEKVANAGKLMLQQWQENYGNTSEGEQNAE